MPFRAPVSELCRRHYILSLDPNRCRAGCVGTVRELSAIIGHHRWQSVEGAPRKLPDRNTQCPIANDSLALAPAFNFQWAWSSGTVVGRSAGR